MKVSSWQVLVPAGRASATSGGHLTYAGRSLDLTPPWRRATLVDLVAEHAGEQVEIGMDLGELRAVCDRHGDTGTNRTAPAS